MQGSCNPSDFLVAATRSLYGPRAADEVRALGRNKQGSEGSISRKTSAGTATDRRVEQRTGRSDGEERESRSPSKAGLVGYRAAAFPNCKGPRGSRHKSGAERGLRVRGRKGDGAGRSHRPLS
jgi:hypothetical protein